MPRFLPMFLLPLALGVAVAVTLHPGGTPGEHASSAPPLDDTAAEAGPAIAPPPAPRAAPPPRSPRPARPARTGDAPRDPLDPSEAVDPDQYLRTVRAILEAKPLQALRYVRQMKVLYPAGEHEVERARYEIEALVNLGRLSEAEELAEAFMRDHPAEGQHSYRVLYLLRERIRP